jgi:hypothetical protein
MKLFLSSDSLPTQGEWEVVRNHDDFIMTVVLAEGAITTISFDHDLGDDSEDGYWCLRWMVEEMTGDPTFQLPKLKEIIIHNANPVEGETMARYAENAKQHVDQLKDVSITWLDSTAVKGPTIMPDDINCSSCT